jgi:uracil-DNA glycosylase
MNGLESDMCGIPPEATERFREMGLTQLEQAAKQCCDCPLAASRTNVVFGEGAPDADLMFIGEGPGFHEDQQGRPFVGRAGDLLTRMIEAMRFTRAEVYIGNIVKCRPPDNRNPLPAEAAACLPYLLRQIELINPRVLVLLGAVPLKYLFNKTGITRLRGSWLDYRGIQVMPTFHPAYLLRNPPAKREVWQDLQMVMKVLGKL